MPIKNLTFQSTIWENMHKCGYVMGHFTAEPNWKKIAWKVLYFGILEQITVIVNGY
jgi:hypothetical protein